MQTLHELFFFNYLLPTTTTQSVERKTLNLVVVGSSPTVGFHEDEDTKLDLYLATGKLLPVVKIVLQNETKDISTPAATIKESDSTVQTSLGTKDIYKPEEDGKDELESSAPSSVIPSETESADDADLCCCNSE
ncbi:hypothetical protein V6N12_050065 [Hibiscus sabdariffa]|uniref:Uncharacterized protein n=1 Tax=Hibiscus sabdariffa TaxID=183260 RepID=A0ABR2GBC2_9ROSI